MTQQHLITIIVAVYNCADSLEQCIKSVIDQSYPYKELIVMDGGSTDGSVDILKTFDDQITYWESAPDRGIYHAWNKALCHAKGTWISFIGADDFLWGAEVLEQSVPYLLYADQKKIRVVYGQNAFISRNNNEILEIHGAPWTELKEKFKKGVNIPHPGSFHHRSLFSRHGNFDESFKVTGDYEFLLRELLYNDALFIPELFVTGMHIGGLSANLEGFENAVREACVAVKKHHLPLSRLLILRMIQAKAVKLVRTLWGDKALIYAADGYRSLVGKGRFFKDM